MKECRTRLEQETSVTFNESEDHAVVWTASPVTLRKFAKLGLQPVRVDSPTAKAFHVPRNWIAIRAPKKMNMTPEKRQALADRMRNISQKRI